MHDHQTRPTKPVVQPLVKEGGEAAVQAAPADPGVLQLQRSHGNRYVQRMVALARQAAGQAEGGELAPEVESSIQSARGGGQALDGGVRAQMEPALGADLSGVRVHTGAEADRLNKAVSARAFTTGNDVFFRQGEYSPGSSSGRELLAHELTHVVQQGGSPVQAKLTLGAVNTPEEREADEVSRQVARGETGVQRSPDVAAGPSVVRRAPLRYAEDFLIISPPDQPFTLQDAQDLVDQRKTAAPADLTSGAVQGATAGSEAEIFLWYILAAYGTRDKWGTETDTVTQIGWPVKKGDPAPVGKVTVRIDDKGNGVAELLSTGAVKAPTTHAKVEDAEKELQTHGISVKNGGADWTPEDLNKVIGALALLPAGEIAALDGVDLVRVHSLGGDTAGEFSSSGSLSDDTTVEITATLKLADKAFEHDSSLFVGGTAAASPPSPRSYQTIVHEIGHAIATKALRDARAAHVRSVAAANQLILDHNAAIEVSNAAVEEYNDAVDVYNAAVKAKDKEAAKEAKKVVDEKKAIWDAALKETKAKEKAKDAGKKDSTAKEKDKAATMMPAKALTALKTDAGKKQKASDKAFKKAKKSAEAFSPDDQSASESYRQAAENVETAIDNLMTGAADPGADLDPLAEAAQANVKTRNEEREALQAAASGNPALKAFAPVEAAQDAAVAAALLYAYATRRTARVHAFVTFVNKKKIKPFTQYAQDNWPHKPEEFYAEAYSLWRTDQDFLKANYPDLFTWFEGGKYK